MWTGYFGFVLTFLKFGETGLVLDIIFKHFNIYTLTTTSDFSIFYIVEKRISSQEAYRENLNDYRDKLTGIIYILKQANDRSVKVGQTTVSAEARLKSYSRDYELKFDVHKEYEVHESF